MFDPLAFLDPEKMTTFEGILSFDMFQKFAAEDEAAYNRIASGADIGDLTFNETPTTEEVTTEEDPYWLAHDLVLSKVDTLISLVNKHRAVKIHILQSAIDVSHIDHDLQEGHDGIFLFKKRLPDEVERDLLGTALYGHLLTYHPTIRLSCPVKAETYWFYLTNDQSFNFD